MSYEVRYDDGTTFKTRYARTLKEAEEETRRYAACWPNILTVRRRQPSQGRLSKADQSRQHAGLPTHLESKEALSGPKPYFLQQGFRVILDTFAKR